jgi:hypothetical protein
MTKSTYVGVRVAHAALAEAAQHGRGVPLRVLLDIVMSVGEVGEGTAYLALRAAIAHRTKYTAERRNRWPEQVVITGTSQAVQVWRLDAQSSQRAG